MKLSIIIPSIGRETLSKVLEGIRNCNGFREIQPEVLVVLDGKEAQMYSKTLEPGFEVTFLEIDESIGPGKARNMAIEKATGDVLVFLGDDTIPDEDWLRKVHGFHTQNPNEKMGLLGKVEWTEELASDPFHRWLLNHAQFSYKKIVQGGASWYHFYTSNISVKRSLVEDIRFSDKFSGWGFEDTEFGYQLNKKGLELHYDPECKVFHDHKQTLESVVKNTKSARKNAEIFESLHPEARVVPRGGRLFLLRIAILLATLFSPISQEMKWWAAWKKAWVEK